jgi:hypothetical protein
MIASKKSSGNQSGCHHFSIIHLALVTLLMMNRFQQIVTQAERRYNFVVHGLPPHQGYREYTLIRGKKLMNF